MRFGRFRFLKFVALALLAIAVLSAVVMLLWNWLVPALFAGAHAISFAQAVGLLVLSRILFGGFRGRPGWHRHGPGARWAALSDEERERLREGRCGARRQQT
ncbi:MAG: hypothetical protein OJF60_002318 [Burkholderiaceae bacterium]|jgi:hypothetical protein|nr:MAG: hypothetical protein OJF60_002318 [Burkholderiaceae bacterium]